MYTYKKQTNLTFDELNKKVREELSKEGFGVLTEINVQETLKKKINVEFDKYIILGACNPPFAHKALLAEKDVGLLLPCNIVIYEEQGMTTVATILPTKAMSIIENKELLLIAEQVENKLKKVIDSLEVSI